MRILGLLISLLFIASFIDEETIQYRTINRYCSHIQLFEIARKYELDPVLIMSLAYVESKFNPKAVSDAGDYGLMQINEFWLDKYKLTKKQALNPYTNVEIGTRILRYCLDRKRNNLKLALECYNKGEDVKASILKKSEYHRKVLKAYRIYSKLQLANTAFAEF